MGLRKLKKRVDKSKKDITVGVTMKKDIKKETDSVAPNGKPIGIFVISVDDGFVEWSYDFTGLGPYSIARVIKIIGKALRRRPKNSRERTFHVK